MRTKALLVGLAVLMIALSGCTSDDPAETSSVGDDMTADDHGDDGDDLGSDGATDDSNGTDDGADGPAPADNGTDEPSNTLPTATLEADNVTGEAPMQVTFNISAEDADGDDLSWTLDVDGDSTPDAEGDEVPATYTHTYESGFTGNASLVVSDGTEEVATAVEIDIVDAPEPEVIEIGCDVIAGAALISGNGIGGCQLGSISEDRVYHDEDEPSGCSIEFDADGDSFSDGEAEIGTQYSAGTSFTAFCDPGVAGVTVTAWLAEVL